MEVLRVVCGFFTAFKVLLLDVLCNFGRVYFVESFLRVSNENVSPDNVDSHFTSSNLAVYYSRSNCVEMKDSIRIQAHLHV